MPKAMIPSARGARTRHFSWRSVEGDQTESEMFLHGSLSKKAAPPVGKKLKNALR
jgi:hypothetical protein